MFRLRSSQGHRDRILDNWEVGLRKLFGEMGDSASFAVYIECARDLTVVLISVRCRIC